MEIELRGDELRVAVNGAETVRTKISALNPNGGTPRPGLTRREGPIGLQQYNGTVRFRNIEVKDLTTQ
jgi:hypothetical protein